MRREDTLSALQRTYLDGRDSAVLSLIYLELCSMADTILRKICKAKHLVFSDFDEKVHDSVNVIIQKYLADPDFMIHSSFSYYLYKSIESIIYERRFSRQQRREIPIEFVSGLQCEDYQYQRIHREDAEASMRRRISRYIRYRLSPQPIERQTRIRKHIDNCWTRGKSIESYLYRISRKQDRELFVSIMDDIREMLRAEASGKENPETQAALYIHEQIV